MYQLPQKNKEILIKNIRRYKQKSFPGKGSGIRLAEEIGTTPQMISNWLNGSRLPTITQLYRLATAFEVSPLELCGIRVKRNLTLESAHVSVLINVLHHCEKDILTGVNPRITRKFLMLAKSIIDKEIIDDIHSL